MSDSDDSITSEFSMKLQLASDEVQILDKCINTIEKVNDDLQSMLDDVQKLMKKHNQPLSYFQMLLSTPGGSWSSDEYSTWDFDDLINEKCQKDDLDEPQQHHKLQEINEDSTTQEGFINHPTEAKEDSTCGIDINAGGEACYLSKRPSNNIAKRYQKFKKETTQLNQDIKALKSMVDCSLQICRLQSLNEDKIKSRIHRRVISSASSDSIQEQ